MESLEKLQPKNIENVRDRFMDFIGNPLNGVLGCLDSLEDTPNRERMIESLNRSWMELFQRLAAFRDSSFQPVGNITFDNIDKILSYKDNDPFVPGVVEEVDALYNSIVNPTIVQEQDIADFINKRHIDPEHFSVIEELATIPKSVVIVHAHNLFNMYKERSAGVIEKGLASAENEDTKRLYELLQTFHSSYDWATCFNLVRVIERRKTR
jgi:hypothetical protein